MSEELNNGALRLAVAQICQSMGWDALNKSTHDLLTDVLQRYMLEIAKCAHEYSHLYCHSEPSLDDLGLAFKQTGVLLHELEDYVSQVDQVPFSNQLPQFPLPKPNQLQHPRKEDILDRPEFYNDHMPPLIKALQQIEDEREGSKEESVGIADPSSQSFLRNEIKTVGKETENQPTENFPDKRSLVISSPDLETESKRRRVEKENNLDILQVLQEKNNITSSSPISPDFAPETPTKPLFTFTSTSTPAPPSRGSTKKTKAEKPSKQKKLLSPPKPKSAKQPSPSKSKTPDKSKAKVETPSKDSTPITSPPLQKTTPFSKPKTPKTPKKSKAKVTTPEKKETIPEPNFVPPLTVNPVPTNIKQEGSQPMPKLIIKPMKLEKNQSSGYSVSAVPLDEGLVTEKSNTLKPFAPKTNEHKPKKKKKKKDSIVVSSSGIDLPLQAPMVNPDIHVPSTSTGIVNPPVMDKIGEPVKKKKKKHKDKGKDKSKPKKVKEASSVDPSAHIPTIKLKLENTPTTTIPSKTIPIEKMSVTTSEPAIIKPKEEPLLDLQRTVITETLSTTVAPVQVYYCPACGLADDGSFMIGCDTCDSWYHGGCVGIMNDPGGDWFCNPCLTKKAKKKKKKKKKTNE